LSGPKAEIFGQELLIMLQAQAAVLQDVPAIGRYVFFSIANPDPAALRAGLSRLAGLVDGAQVLVGLGPPLVQLLGVSGAGAAQFCGFDRARCGRASHPGCLVLLAARHRDG
jgi:hypothetical protein